MTAACEWLTFGRRDAQRKSIGVLLKRVEICYNGQMLRKIYFTAMCLCLLLVPEVGAAAHGPIHVGSLLNFGTSGKSVPDMIQGIIFTLKSWAHGIAIMIFLFGAFCMIASRGKDEGFFALSKGKKTMEAAVIGLAIVYGSWLILSTVLFLIGA